VNCFSSNAKGPQKYGRPNEATPAKWQQDYKDFNAPLENGTAAQPKTETTTQADVLSAPPIPPVDAPPPAVPAESRAVLENGDSKKRKRHEGETSEEKAERKRKKKEKKEKKEKRKSKKGDSSDDSE